MAGDNKGGRVGGGDGGGEEYDPAEADMTPDELETYRKGKRDGAARGIQEWTRRRGGQGGRRGRER